MATYPNIYPGANYGSGGGGGGTPVSDGEIEVLIDASTTLSAVNQSLRVTNSVVNTISNTILGATPSNAVVITVPESAVVAKAGQDFIFRVHKDQVGQVTIALEGDGSLNGNTSAIRLVVGGTVVLHVLSNAGDVPVCIVSGDIYANRIINGDLNVTGALSINGTGIATALKVNRFQISGLLPPTADDYKVLLKSLYAFTVNSATVKTTAGTCTLNFKINSTSITSLSSVSATSSETETNATAANSVAVGDDLVITLSSPSSMTGEWAEFSINCTR